MPDFQTVCRVSDVPKGEARRFVLGGRAIGVFHVGDEFLAIANECPHAGASLADGYIEGDVVACRIHHWHFCLRRGTCLDETQRKCDVQAFSVRIVGDEVQVALSPTATG
jgi:nitrite reductase (NADH) small subunit/3-phenylpropionate/trans-cinnamate dioxygenase ferredoxin subunit